ncbi:TetR/AcrR family transcriptional regulator [Mycobacterium sp.]|uniref:TetR/AcrR family transcriptional regulator n=1 Tax=Mycobacterium sp. TaxID=1785 RepID=UPI003A8C8124
MAKPSRHQPGAQSAKHGGRAESGQPGRPGAKVDARSERWREHRKKVRGDIVDAAFRAIDRLGPELSVREIAEEAGTAKPKIYRHFADKSDLFRAIGERLRDMLWAAIFPSINLATDSVRQVIGCAVEEFVGLLDEHPNVVRVFLQNGGSGSQPNAMVRPFTEGREITLTIAEMFNDELRDMELSGAALELAAFSAFGCAASATEWWLGPESDSTRSMTRERFVTQLTTILLGVIVGTAETMGIVIDPDKPIHDTVPTAAV